MLFASHLNFRQVQNDYVCYILVKNESITRIN